jgi:hypothetical protein
MPNNGAVTLTPTTTNVAITAGYHDGSGYVAGDADLAAGNIRSGVSIFGVAGDPHVVNTASGDATAGDILSGTVAWVDGSEVTGSMPDNGALVITPTTTSQTIAAGYHDGSGYVVGDADLVAGNIKGGVSVFGVDGALYAPVPKTGQTQCYNTAGTEISCTDTGQDGDYQKGVTWPNPRFITSTTGIVTDTLTGLIWLQDASCTAFFSGDATGQNNRAWSDALMATNLLASGYCGLTDGSVAGDWRLPNAREMQSLAHYGFYNPAVPNTAGTGQWSEGDPFSGVQSISYWSGTTFASDTSFAWRVQLYYGSLVASTKADTYHVWPVRGGQ